MLQMPCLKCTKLTSALICIQISCYGNHVYEDFDMIRMDWLMISTRSEHGLTLMIMEKIVMKGR